MKNQILLTFLVVVSFTYALPNENSKDPKIRGFFSLGSLLANDPTGTYNGRLFGGFGYGGQSPPSFSNSCRYWCRTPLGQYYCCENSKQSPSNVGVKSGFCPPVRPACPPTRFGPPKTCSNDYSCRGTKKCCFDTCLQQHVCKPRQFSRYW